MTIAEEKINQVYYLCEACDRDTWHPVLHSHVKHEYKYPIDDHEWYIPENVSCFPRVLKGHRELQDIWNLSNTVREIGRCGLQEHTDITYFTSSSIFVGHDFR